MFPYGYYNNPSNLFGYAALPYVFGRRYGDFSTLPEEVKESLELHTGEFKSEEDIDHFLHEQELRK